MQGARIVFYDELLVLKNILFRTLKMYRKLVQKMVGLAPVYATNLVKDHLIYTLLIIRNGMWYLIYKKFLKS